MNTDDFNSKAEISVSLFIVYWAEIIYLVIIPVTEPTTANKTSTFHFCITHYQVDPTHILKVISMWITLVIHVGLCSTNQTLKSSSQSWQRCSVGWECSTVSRHLVFYNLFITCTFFSHLLLCKQTKYTRGDRQGLEIAFTQLLIRWETRQVLLEISHLRVTGNHSCLLTFKLTI